MNFSKCYLPVLTVVISMVIAVGCNRKVARTAQKTGGLADACKTLNNGAGGGSGSSGAFEGGDDASPFGAALFLNPEPIDQVGKVNQAAINIEHVTYQGLFSVPSITIVPTSDMLSGHVETVFVKVTDLDGVVSYPPIDDDVYEGYYRPYSGVLRLGCMKDLIGKQIKINFYPCVHQDNLRVKKESQHGHGYVCYEDSAHKYTRVMTYNFFSPDYKDSIPVSDREQIVNGICELERAQYKGNTSMAQDLKKIAHNYFSGGLTGGNDSIRDALSVYKDIHGIGSLVSELSSRTPLNLEYLKDIEATTEQEGANLALANTNQQVSAADCVDGDNSSGSSDTSGNDTYDPYSTSSSGGYEDELFPTSSSGGSSGGDEVSSSGSGSSSGGSSAGTSNETPTDDTASTTGGEGSEEEGEDLSKQGPNPVEASLDPDDSKSGLYVAIGVSVIAFSAAGAAITNQFGLWGEKRVRNNTNKIIAEYKDSLEALKNISPDDNLTKKLEAYDKALDKRLTIELGDNKESKIADLRITESDLPKIFGPDYNKTPRVVDVNEDLLNKRSIDLSVDYKGRPYASDPNAPKTGGRWKGIGAVLFYIFAGVSSAFVASSYSLAGSESKRVEDELIAVGNAKIALEEQLQEKRDTNSSHYKLIRDRIEDAR